MSIDEIEQTPVDGLFERSDVATPADDTMQWRAALLQMVNWGGFDGLTVVPLRGDATMISGASGVGKSTILDAYTALMMPSDTKFNGASNDAVAGRARGAGQRNLLSYLRGAVDVVDDPRTGRPVEKLLRGKGADTWGAIAMTFVNDQGGRFTVLRTYYVPRRATRSADVQMQLATQDGALPLDTLEVAVPERFHATTLKKLYPGIRVHRTYAELAAVLHARLGIGANGDGAKALRLLARIQAGNQVRSVDELYKDMVLERPSTFAAADRAIEHFDDLDTAHSAMRTEEQKLELLAPITDLHDRKVAATRRLAELDSYGVTLDGDTPLRMWLLRTHLRLIESAVVDNRADRAAAADELGTTTSAERTYLADLEAAKESHRAAGGSTLQSLALSLEQEQVVREDRLGRREVLQERLLPLIDVTDAQAPDVEAALLSSESFAVLQMHAQQWLAGFQREQERIRRERDAVLRDQFPLSQRQAELRRERTSLESRAGRVPARMDELRAEVAQASGIGVDELPFVAELVDVAPDEARWRTAIETVLGASARMMLVPLDRLESFASAIDGLRLRGRLTFEGVELDLPDLGPADPERVAGKLVFKDSPFSGWVQAHVGETSRNALCVESADGLAGAGFRVTLAGQTRNGRRGAHGRNDTRSIIGFSNADAIAEVDAELAELEERLDGVGARGGPARPAVAGAGAAAHVVRRRGRRALRRLRRRRQRPTHRRPRASSDGDPRVRRRPPGAGRADRRPHRTAGGDATGPLRRRAAAARAQRRPRRPRRRRGRRQGPAPGDGGRRPGRAQPRSRRPPSRWTSPPPRRPRTPTTSTGSRSRPSGSPSGSAPRSATPRPRSAGSTTTSPRCSGSTSSSGTRPTWARPRTPTPTTPASSTRSAARASPPGGPSGDAGSRSGAARTWCPSSVRWPRPSRRSRTGSSRSTRSCDAWSSGRRGTGCGSACGGWRPPTSRRS